MLQLAEYRSSRFQILTGTSVGARNNHVFSASLDHHAWCTFMHAVDQVAPVCAVDQVGSIVKIHHYKFIVRGEHLFNTISNRDIFFLVVVVLNME